MGLYLHEGRVLGWELLSGPKIDQIVDGLAQQIYHDYADTGRKLLVLYITNGAVILYAKVRQKLMDLGFPLEMIFDENLAVTTYRRGLKVGEPRILKEVGVRSLAKFDVLIVEDVLDSTATMRAIISYLAYKEPRSLEICVLVRKRWAGGLRAKYTGAEVDKRFWAKRPKSVGF